MKPHEAMLNDEKCAIQYELDGEEFLSGHDHFLYASDGDEQHVACIPYDAPGGPEQWVRLFQGAKGMTEALLFALTDMTCVHSIRPDTESDACPCWCCACSCARPGRRAKWRRGSRWRRRREHVAPLVRGLGRLVHPLAGDEMIRLLKQFLCGLAGHGETQGIIITDEATRITLWECCDCGAQWWKRTRASGEPL